MDNYQGDLADMVRASCGAIRTITTVGNTTATTLTAAATSITTDEQIPESEWQFRSSNPDLCPFPDLLLNNMDLMTSTALSSFINVGFEERQNTPYEGGGGGGLMMNNFNMFAKALQISSNMYSSTDGNNDNSTNNSNNNNNNSKMPSIARGLSSFMETDSGLLSNEMIINNNASTSSNKKDEFLDNCTSGTQITSLESSANKRRKSQAKRVVCIPAPTGAYSRQSGEVVPSDLWAWRKYGQKPIKDSPYPRGYYRCSSSKGCSARKQVERSRTDPNMLVITYTSEHNHPWPTQRNALAGSTRSQSSKNIATALTSSKLSKALVEEEVSNNKETSQAKNFVEEEMRIEKQVEEKGEDNAENSGCDQGHELSLTARYKPIMHGVNGKQPEQDLSMELGFDGDDPLDLIFTQEIKASDPFNGLFDWDATQSAVVQSSGNQVKRVS